jgi:hypothetical protein
MGAGFLDVLVFDDTATDLLAAGLATGAGLAVLPVVALAAGFVGFADFATVAEFFAFTETGALLGAAAFLATVFDFTEATGFFPAGAFTTAFFADGLDAADALGFGPTALAVAFTLAFAAGFARAATLPGFAVDLVFFVTFAISVLTL